MRRAEAAATDASPAELATRGARGAQGSRGAPHSGSLPGRRRSRGLHAESQRRFYGYLLSTDSNCRSLLTAPSRTRTLLPEGNNKAFSIQQRQRRQKGAILGPGTLRGERPGCAHAAVTCCGWSREKAAPASREHAPPVVAPQDKEATSFVLDLSPSPRFLGRRKFARATLRLAAARGQPRFPYVFHNNRRGHVRGEGVANARTELGVAVTRLGIGSIGTGR